MLLSSLPVVSGTLLYEGKEKIALFENGVTTKGYWTIDARGKPLKLISPAHEDNKLTLKNGNYTLIKRERKKVISGETPFPNPITKMTQKTCTKVDLTPKLGPVHNQTGGTCYAYTAIDLLNYGSAERYSALYLAMLKPYVAPKPVKESDLCPGQVMPGKTTPLEEVGGLSGGRVHQAIKLGMDKGLCPERLLPSSNGVLKKDYKKFLEYYELVNKTRSEIDEECKKELSANPFDLKLIEMIEQKSRSKNDVWNSIEVQVEIKNMYPALSTHKVKEISNSSKNADELVKRLNEESCKSNLIKGLPRGKGHQNVVNNRNMFSIVCDKFFYEDDREDILDQINNGLNSSIPTGISYVTGGLIQPPKEITHSYHASVVAGRDFLKEEKDSSGRVIRPAGCYYLVKNSWGEDWKVKEGLKARNSELHPGYFVISEKQLMEHAYGATSID